MYANTIPLTIYNLCPVLVTGLILKRVDIVKVLVKQKMFTPAQPGLEAGQGGDLAEPPLTEDGGQAALTLTFLTILTILCDLFVDRGHFVGSHSLFFIYGLPALTPHINRDQRCSYVPSLNSGIIKISLNK